MSVKRRRTTWAIVILMSAGSLAACSVSMTGGIFGLIVSVALGATVLLGASTQQSCSTQACLSMIEDLDGETPDETYIGPCLGAPYDPNDEPRRSDPESSDVEVGPCLSAPPPEDFDTSPPADTSEVEEPPIGPCLSAPPPEDFDAGAPERPDADSQPMDVGPPDTPDGEGPGDTSDGEGLGDKDGEEAGPEVIEPPIGPCLSPPAPEIFEEDAGASDAEIEPPIGPCLSPPMPDPPDVLEDDADVSQAAPAAQGSRAEIIERLGARGVLPADVLKRLSDREEG